MSSFPSVLRRFGSEMIGRSPFCKLDFLFPFFDVSINSNIRGRHVVYQFLGFFFFLNFPFGVCMNFSHACFRSGENRPI